MTLAALKTCVPSDDFHDLDLAHTDSAMFLVGKDLQNLVGDKWLPGLNTPFDPFAVKIGLKLRKKLALYIGRKEAFFSKIKGEEFKGTIVEG